MGAYFTSLLQSTGSMRESIAKFVLQFRLAQVLSQFRLPWPPPVSAVRRYAPYFFFAVFFPKLASDVFAVARKPVLDERLEREETKKLEAALVKSTGILEAFRQCDLVVPADLAPIKAHVRREVDALFERHSLQAEEDAVATMKFVDDIVPGLADGKLDFPPIGDKLTEGAAEGDDAVAVAAEGEGGPGGLVPGDGVMMMPGGAEIPHGGSVDEELTTFLSNLEVAVRKIEVPDNPAHPLHDQALESKIVMTMLMDIYVSLQNSLALRKTEHYTQYSDEVVSRATNAGEAKKWRTGNPLRDVWTSSPRFPWWDLIDPRDMPRDCPAVKEHHTHHRRSVNPRARWTRRSPGLKKAILATLVHLERGFETQERLLKRLQSSKMTKILKFVRFIIGGPWNWAAVAANWGVKLVQGMISGAGLFYRSQLLITAQAFAMASARSAIAAGASAGAAAAVGGAGGADYSKLTDVVFAIVVTELARITVNDLASRVEQYGSDAIRRRLRNLIVEKVLSQDLEDFERNNNQNGMFGSSGYQQLLHQFPIRKYIMLPAQFLQAISGAITTGYLLWSKNWYLFCVVSAVLVGKRLLTSRVRQLQQWVAMYLSIYRGRGSGSYYDKVNIYEALSNFEDVRVNGTEVHHLRQFREQDSHQGAQQTRQRSYGGIFSSFHGVINELPTLITYMVGCTLIASGTLQPADLATFPDSIQSIMYDYDNVKNQFDRLYDFDDYEVRTLDKMVDILSETPTIGIHGGLVPESLDDFDASVEFRGVAFHRPKWPIRQKGISFKAPAGSFVALCGKNGVGKSTLFRLLLRLYDADEGTILLGGRDIKEYNPIFLRSKAVSMAVQKPAIYRSSLRANCIYGSEHLAENMISDAQVDAAIEKVLKRSGTFEMFKDPRSFAQGFDTVKRHMSGGQERAVGLARALFKGSKILLLDEPTNDLDPDRQQAVKESLIENRPPGQTILCITHDLSTIQDADVILFFEKDPKTGITTIAAQGKYEDLIKTSEGFKSWHEYKWGSHNTNVALAIDSTGGGGGGGKDGAAPAASAAAGDGSSGGGGGDDDDVDGHAADGDAGAMMSTMAVSTTPNAREEFLRQQLEQLHQLQRQLARGAAAASHHQFHHAHAAPTLLRPALRSAPDFQQFAGAVRYRLDTLPPMAVARLIPQYEALLQQMRLVAHDASHRTWSNLTATGRSQGLLRRDHTLDGVLELDDVSPGGLDDDDDDGDGADAAGSGGGLDVDDLFPLLGGPPALRRSRTDAPYYRYGARQLGGLAPTRVLSSSSGGSTPSSPSASGTPRVRRLVQTPRSRHGSPAVAPLRMRRQHSL